VTQEQRRRLAAAEKRAQDAFRAAQRAQGALIEADEALGAAMANLDAVRASLLRSVPNQGNLDRVDQRLFAPPAKRRPGRPTGIRHPFPDALAAAGTSVSAWAAKHGLHQKNVQAWFSPKPAGRKIPLRWAKTIEREYVIPASDDVWPNGIK
jgi:hypothetical protein